MDFGNFTINLEYKEVLYNGIEITKFPFFFKALWAFLNTHK